MKKPQVDISLAALVDETREMIHQTLSLARTRQRALKLKPNADETAAIDALEDMLWQSHTEAAAIAYQMRKRRR